MNCFRPKSLRRLGACALIAAALSTGRPADTHSNPLTDADRERIEAALPDHPAATPLQPRRLLIFDLNVGYGGHPSIHSANHAIARFGERTGAFSTRVSQDPEVFRPESLRQFDAVFLNNTVGNLFTDPDLRRSLVEFVYAGGGLLGVHGTTVAFTRWPGAHEDWPEFGVLLGARGANHRDSDEHVFIRLDDPTHALNAVFEGAGFDYRDEFFRVQSPYSRDRVRVLLSIDTVKTDLAQGAARGECIRVDNDYALAWVRGYGRGRVFYCTIAHNPGVFSDPRMLKFYLGAIQFALGDLPGATTPSNRLSPRTRALEQHGWRVAIDPAAVGAPFLFNLLQDPRPWQDAGALYLASQDTLTISPDLPRRLTEHLSPTEAEQVRLRLDSAGLRLLTCDVPRLPPDPDHVESLFQQAHRMGIETLVTRPPSENWTDLEALCNRYHLQLAVPIDSARDGADRCAKLDPRIGIWLNLGRIQAAGTDPVESVRLLNRRLLVLALDDHVTPDTASRVAREMERLRLTPVIVLQTRDPQNASRLVDALLGIPRP